MEPLTQGEARALLCAKELLDSGELPGPVYDTLAGWVTRKLGIRDLPNILRSAESLTFISDSDESGDELDEIEPSEAARAIDRT
jgi:hypothetical protein